MYVGDAGNNRVAVIGLDGSVSTLAASPASIYYSSVKQSPQSAGQFADPFLPSGVAFSPSNSALVVSNAAPSGAGFLASVSPGGSPSALLGQASNVALLPKAFTPGLVSVDAASGALLVVDTAANTVYRLPSARSSAGFSLVATTATAPSLAKAVFASAVADAAGHVIVADRSGGITGAGVFNLTSGTSLFSGTLTAPTSLALDASAGLLVANGSCVFSLCPPRYDVINVVGCGLPFPAAGVAADSTGSVYAVSGNQVVKFFFSLDCTATTPPPTASSSLAMPPGASAPPPPPPGVSAPPAQQASTVSLTITLGTRDTVLCDTPSLA